MQPELTVVTTCDAQGWEIYGRKMAQSFRQYWPKDMELRVYVEGFVGIDGITSCMFPDWFLAFKERHRDNPKAHGVRHEGGKYSFRWDCVKFAHKVAALTDTALEAAPTRLLVWVDADTRTKASVSFNWLDDLMPMQAWMAWLDRPNYHPECGFMMFRPWTGGYGTFMRRLKADYETDAVLSRAETHDSYVIQQLAEQYCDEMGVPRPHSLSGGSGSLHPFLAGPLGARMDHMKGKRKYKDHPEADDPRWDAHWRKRPRAS